MQKLDTRMKRGFTAILMMTAFLLSGCSIMEGLQPSISVEPAPSFAPAVNAQESETSAFEDTEASNVKFPTYSVWIPYWDTINAILELTSLGASVQNVIAFGAIFDEHDHPFLLEDMTSTLELLKSTCCEEQTLFLSVINDVALSTGGYDNKTTEPLERLLKTDKSTDAHIEELIQLVRSSGADGLEIDYEAIRDDVPLRNRFSEFIERLYKRTSKEGIPLRVVLEYEALKRSNLPDGPVYVVMCYNLFGMHSDAGPKADFQFLDDAFAYSRNLPGEVDMAFATGGFIWSGKSVTAVSQIDAEAMVRDDGIVCSRDENSGVLHAEFTDRSGAKSEIWYADAETLAIWRDRALDAGYNSVSIFRLGGNDSEDLKRLFQEEVVLADSLQ